VLKTFKKGGIHPADNKFSAGQQIMKAGLPETAVIPLSQHGGAPASPLVKKGDKVKTGQQIGKSEGFISANIHSSVSGTVIKTDFSPDVSGYKKQAVFIKVEGDEWEDDIHRSDTLKKDITDDAKTIIEKVTRAGIVGLGGATFPSNVKLSIPEGKKAQYLIINGVECEPYLTSDHRVMLEHTEELLVGIQIIMKALDVSAAYIGIENNKPDAISKLSNMVKETSGINVVPLKMKYPQGSEKQLIKAITKKEVPPGGLPVDVGAVVFNVGTTVAVYEAVQKNKPLFERVVTVTGKNVTKPGNFLTRIGTPVSMLIDAAGGIPEKTGKIISGGPMMGKAIVDVNIPVNKGMSGIVLMPENESLRPDPVVCLRCSKCISACPMHLEPYLLYHLAKACRYEELENNRVMDCMECGSCSFTCPGYLPLLDYIRLGKANVIKLIKARKQ
jgi:Na+-translocating ferredoxin:NAD+ oxidoreductase subunit C